MVTRLLILALCATVALSTWKSQVAVTALSSGGQPLFWNYQGSSFTLQLGKGADGDSAPPPTSQSFDFSAGFPNGVFTIKTGSKFIQLVAGAVVVSSTVTAAANAQWTKTAFGVFISAADTTKALDVATVHGNSKIIATTYSATSRSQQFVTLPSADSGFQGTIMLWDSDHPNQCLQGPFDPKPFNGQLPGFPNKTVQVFPMPLLAACDPTNKYQLIKAIDPTPAVTYLPTPGGFATGWFQLQFNQTQTCITFIDPNSNTVAGRQAMSLILADCNQTDPATSGMYQWFAYDSRGQLQSYLVPTSTQNKDNIVVNCFSNDGRYAAVNVNDKYYNSSIQGSDCSFLKYGNRWSFLDPSW